MRTPFRFLRSAEVMRLSLCGSEAPLRCLPLLHLLALPVLDCAILAGCTGPRRPARGPLRASQPDSNTLSCPGYAG